MKLRDIYLKTNIKYFKGLTYNNIFNSVFSIKIAKSKEDLETVYRLRHMAYCEENNFEPQNEYRQEVDEFDKHSMHSIIYYKPTGDALGTVRVVLPHGNDYNHYFPVQEHMDNPFLHNRLEMNNHSEISRLAIPSSIKNKIMEDRSCWSFYEKTITGCLAKYAVLGLFRASIEMSLLNNVPNCIYVAEPRLINMLNRVGVKWVKILGEAVEYHGTGIRQPISINILENATKGLYACPDTALIITDNNRIQKLATQVEANRMRNGSIMEGIDDLHALDEERMTEVA
ncbi:MAG: PEP-CTERM/exosortase system-associated acyltransferase [Pseudomonadota bacterium]|jgi:N-acyl amino acid synthase of PEP-CTERM/exosortase system|nr:PEP-CTERM/exosortase system-associated acyltransferase [Pseudomonadota bacterium]MED5423806.1 PEP-CTERM/exosortase system-associated acyltransferase [Pseudomonadota bacterium]